MRTIKTFIILFGLIFTSYYGFAQERVFVRVPSVNVVKHNNKGDKKATDNYSVILQAVPIDPNEKRDEKTYAAIYTNNRETEMKSNRQRVYLTVKPASNEIPELREAISIDGKPRNVQRERKVEIKAVLVPTQE